MATQREKKGLLAILYFDKEHGKTFKELAKRVRMEHSKTRLVWSHLFIGPEDMNESARAVIIQKGCKQADIIAKCYNTLADDVEVHWVTSDGIFEEDLADQAEPEPETKEDGETEKQAEDIPADTAVPEEATESSTSAESEAVDDGDSQPEGTESSEDGSVSGIGSEVEQLPEEAGSVDSTGTDEVS